MSKITIATVKSFINKNRADLLVNQKSSFDGMTDCVQSHDFGFSPAVDALNNLSNNLNIRGVWICGRGHDYCTAYDEKGVKGFEVYNSCGTFVVGVAA